jgi:hypothetical protein
MTKNMQGYLPQLQARKILHILTNLPGANISAHMKTKHSLQWYLLTANLSLLGLLLIGLWFMSDGVFSETVIMVFVAVYVITAITAISKNTNRIAYLLSNIFGAISVILLFRLYYLYRYGRGQWNLNKKEDLSQTGVLLDIPIANLILAMIIVGTMIWLAILRRKRT